MKYMLIENLPSQNQSRDAEARSFIMFALQVAAIFKIGNSKDIPEIPDFLSSDAKSFLYLCLQRDPADRPLASQLLDHPFVRDQSVGRALNANATNEASAFSFDGRRKPVRSPRCLHSDSLFTLNSKLLSQKNLQTNLFLQDWSKIFLVYGNLCPKFLVIFYEMRENNIGVCSISCFLYICLLAANNLINHNLYIAKKRFCFRY